MLREHDVVGSNPALPAFTWQGGVGELLGVIRPRIWGDSSTGRTRTNIEKTVLLFASFARKHAGIVQSASTSD